MNFKSGGSSKLGRFQNSSAGSVVESVDHQIAVFPTMPVNQRAPNSTWKCFQIRNFAKDGREGKGSTEEKERKGKNKVVKDEDDENRCLGQCEGPERPPSEHSQLATRCHSWTCSHNLLWIIIRHWVWRTPRHSKTQLAFEIHCSLLNHRSQPNSWLNGRWREVTWFAN